MGVVRRRGRWRRDGGLGGDCGWEFLFWTMGVATLVFSFVFCRFEWEALMFRVLIFGFS